VQHQFWLIASSCPLLVTTVWIQFPQQNYISHQLRNGVFYTFIFRFEFLLAVNIKSTVFTDVTPCSLVDSPQCFWSTCYPPTSTQNLNISQWCKGTLLYAAYTNLSSNSGILNFRWREQVPRPIYVDIMTLQAEGSMDWILVGGEIFCTCPDWPWGLPSHLVPGLFSGVKQPRRDNDQPPPSSSAKVKERVELHLYTPSGPSWHVPGSTLPFISHSINHIIRISYSSQTLINNITDHIKSHVCVLLLCLFDLHPFSFSIINIIITTTLIVILFLPLLLLVIQLGQQVKRFTLWILCI